MLKKVAILLILTTSLLIGGCNTEPEENEGMDDATLLQNTFSNHLNQRHYWYQIHKKINFDGRNTFVNYEENSKTEIKISKPTEDEGLVLINYDNDYSIPFATYLEIDGEYADYFMGIRENDELVWYNERVLKTELLEKDQSFLNTVDILVNGLSDNQSYVRVADDTTLIPGDETSYKKYEFTINEPNLFSVLFINESELIEKYGMSKEDVQPLLEEVACTVRINEDKQLITKIECDLSDDLYDLMNRKSSFDRRVETFTIEIYLAYIEESNFSIPESIKEEQIEADLEEILNSY